MSNYYIYNLGDKTLVIQILSINKSGKINLIPQVTQNKMETNSLPIYEETIFVKIDYPKTWLNSIDKQIQNKFEPIVRNYH